MSRLFSPLQQGLAGLCGLLMMTLGWQLFAPSLPTAVTVTSWNPPGLETALTTLPSPRPDTFSRINDRPIFSPTRTPVTPSPKAGEAPATPPDATLIGVIIDGQSRLALVRTTSSPLEVSVTVGSALGAWTVTAIESDHITLRAGTKETEIRLNANHGSSSGAMPDQTSTATEPTTSTNSEQPSTNTTTTTP